MHALFAALLEQPSARRYKQLRAKLLSGDSLGDFTLRLAELEQRLATNPDDWSTLLADLLGPGLLSLRLHRLGGQAALLRGDVERGMLHRFTYDTLAAAILTTGDGTRRHPLLPTYASDAREVLAKSARTVVSQSLVEDAHRRFDVLLADDEREFWFDVTDLLPQIALANRGPKRPLVRRARKAAVSRS